MPSAESRGERSRETMARTKRTKRGRRRVRFEYRAEPGHRVCVAGSFNGWDPRRTVLVDRTGKGDYSRAVLLVPGRYEYKFVVDGVWCVDPENPRWVPNEFGTLNSVLDL